MPIEQGFYALLGAFVGFWLKAYVFPYARKKGENLATREDIAEITEAVEAVRSQYIEEAEKIKADLATLVHEQQTRFSRLHDKRLESIDGLYVRLFRTQQAMGPLAGAIRSIDDTGYDERLKQAQDVATDLLVYFAERRLYLPQEVIAAFEEINSLFNEAWVTFALERRGEDWPNLTTPERTEQVELWKAARETIRKKVPELHLKIEAIMRDALGDGPLT